MQNYKLSIITSTYNRPELLDRMIGSLLKQTYANWELVIIDDSTDDETKKYMDKHLNNLQIIYRKNDNNEGLPYSRNRGIDIAKGDWITFLDDDDIYVDSTALQRVVDVLKSDNLSWHIFNRVNPAGVSFTKCLEPTDNNCYNWLRDFLFGRAMRGDAVHFIKKDLIKNTRYRGPHRAEWYFWYDLAKKSNYRYNNIPVVQAEYLPDGMSNLGYLKKERIYQGQQFREMIRHINTWRYLPIIAIRYVMSFVIVRKILNWLKSKHS